MSALAVGVIGTGMMGEVHARLLNDRIGSARVVAVSDPDTERRRMVAEAVGAAEFDDPMGLIAAPEVEAVVIASPDHSHAGFAVASVQAGKPCMCEKPLATTVDDARLVVDAEVALGRRLVQVGFMREFDEGHASLVSLRRSGALGEVVAVRSTHVNPAPWAPGVTAERVITQSMIHDIHSARFLSGAEVEAVSASVVPFAAGSSGVDDGAVRFVAARLELVGGAVALLDVNVSSAYGYRVVAEVVGSECTARTSEGAAVEMWSSGARVAKVSANWPEHFSAAYLTELTAWVSAASKGGVTGPSAWDGLMANVVAEALVDASTRGERVEIARWERPAVYER